MLIIEKRKKQPVVNSTLRRTERPFKSIDKRRAQKIFTSLHGDTVKAVNCLCTFILEKIAQIQAFRKPHLVVHLDLQCIILVNFSL